MKVLLGWFGLLLTPVAASMANQKAVIRIGHFPNITHAQGLVAHNLSRQGKGWFEARLGPGVEIQWFIYNAGPSAMEAISRAKRLQRRSLATRKIFLAVPGLRQKD